MIPCRTGLVRRCRYVLALATTWAVVLLVWPPAAGADSPNPPWQQRCPQRIALVIDLSESMEPNLDSVQQSARHLIDALRDAPNEVAIVSFGTEAVLAVPATDVGGDDAREQVKEQIDDLTLLEGDLGGTNWEAAFSTAGSLRPDIAILLTDGQPTAHGQPATGGSGPGDPEHLSAAVRAADALKRDGTRIVGLGMGLLPENVGNLVAVTGPTAGEDYYSTDASGLLDRLYDIASKACGVPVALLPQPEPATFPLGPVLAAGVAAVLAAVAGGVLLSRRRPDLAGASASASRLPPGSTISRKLPTSSIAAEEAGPAEARTVTPVPDSERGRREPRRISLARIQNMDPPRRRDHDDSRTEGSGMQEPGE